MFPPLNGAHRSGKSHPFHAEQLKSAHEAVIGKKNIGYALEIYSHLAKNGNAEAQCRLGEMYAYGDNVVKDEEKAIDYFTAAAENAHPGARLNLGVMHFLGRGTEKNAKLGKLYLKQAEAKYPCSTTLIQDLEENTCYVLDKPRAALPAALYLLSQLYKDEDPSKAKEYFNEAVKANHPFAQFLSQSNQHNQFSISKKYFPILEQVGNEGCLATFSLIEHILKGGNEVITKENSPALRYCKLAADAGCANAAFHAGKYYFETNETDLAKTYLQKALSDTQLPNKARGHAALMLFKLEDQRLWGLLSYIDNSAAIAHLKQAAKFGNEEAQNHPLLNAKQTTKEVNAKKWNIN